MTKEQNEILVLGATGKTGRRLVRRLRDAGEKVRAASRSSEVRFDWTRPETWRAALEGTSAVYLVAPDDPAPVHEFVRLAADSGVGRFVAMSGRGMDRVSGEFFQGMAAAEQAVRDSGVPWSVLRPNNFNQNFDEGLWREPLRSGRLALPIGSAPEPFIDAQDIAEAAAVLLTAEEHHDGVHELSGPAALSFGEVVEVIAAAAKRTIRYVELTPEEYRAGLREEGWPEHAVQDHDALFALMRTGVSAEPTDGVKRLLGRDPVSLADYAARAAASGAWS
ncbi:NAD(P)H-binding protein [Actinocorallia sp. B10E7]|uniref:NmrA family NAD(P)-binding protein n=1 Tax=Actinocorallia sp. B10E7 TaxID=3153558 RepID=UPI00325C9641